MSLTLSVRHGLEGFFAVSGEANLVLSRDFEHVGREWLQTRYFEGGFVAVGVDLPGPTLSIPLPEIWLNLNLPIPPLLNCIK